MRAIFIEIGLKAFLKLLVMKKQQIEKLIKEKH